MLGDNHVGLVVAKDEQGYHVEVFRAGQYVRYGPMHCVAPSGEATYEVGDRVFITSVFFRDQFVILGLYIDVHVPFEPLGDETEPDPDGDGIVEVIDTGQP